MVKPPVPQPRTYFTAAPKETSGTSEQGFHNGTNENNAIKVSHMERGSSLHAQNPKPPVPLPRSRSHAEPLIQIPGATHIDSVQQEKDQKSEKLLACEYQNLRPRRPPPPRPTKAPGAHRAPLLRQPSTWGAVTL
ncbi:hypothetical protein AGOR_G00227210 [Albula goreensis]|uniref:Uncharacterized protein n=1 Tax=Albula goreensis TaxID=1534307 RepID=A0A8T3CHI9_9TELE|nr:hypothetical protein AGOR_G00227210 [Albula goreensis]